MYCGRSVSQAEIQIRDDVTSAIRQLSKLVDTLKDSDSTYSHIDYYQGHLTTWPSALREYLKWDSFSFLMLVIVHMNDSTCISRDNRTLLWRHSHPQWACQAPYATIECLPLPREVGMMLIDLGSISDYQLLKSACGILRPWKTRGIQQSPSK